MPTLIFSTEIATTRQRLWEFHDGTSALLRITPPGTRVWLRDPPERLEKGVIFTLIVSQPPIFIPLPWRCEFMEYEPPLRFVDRQVPGHGPFARWEHEHRFEELSETHSRLTDTITYKIPLGPLGRLADALFVGRQLREMFAYRHRVTKATLESV